MPRGLERPVAINTSKSKALFSFGKDSRFKDSKMHSVVHAYDPKSFLKINSPIILNKRNDGGPSGFGISINRFNYIHQKKRAELPSPNDYSIRRSFQATPSSSRVLTKSPSARLVK